MNCIFCKSSTKDSLSVEHIIPESLGNKGHILEKGIVCDNCNNYFAIKVERPLLDLEYFKCLRARNEIESKKGKIPIENVLFEGCNSNSDIRRQPNSTILDVTINDLDFFGQIQNGEIEKLIYSVQLAPPLDNYFISRFLAKVAIEAIAQRLSVSKEGIKYLVDETQFDEIREFARYGKRYKSWPYHTRKIYEENEIFKSEVNADKLQDKLFEYDILVTTKSEYYLVLILKGIEYSINIGGPEIIGYYNWLLENDNKSPLYLDKKNTNA